MRQPTFEGLGGGAPPAASLLARADVLAEHTALQTAADAQHGMAWHAFIRYTGSITGSAWHGMHSQVCRQQQRFSMACMHRYADSSRAPAWHGMAWHGIAWHGMAWHCMAWHGMHSQPCRQQQGPSMYACIHAGPTADNAFRCCSDKPLTPAGVVQAHGSKACRS